MPALTPEAQAAADAADAKRIMRALKTSRGNVGAAAKALDVPRRTLDRRINALGLRDWLTAAFPRGARQSASPSPAAPTTPRKGRR